MPGSKSTYLENATLNHTLGAVIWTPPSVIYIALSSELFDEAATGISFVELVGAGYARVAAANDLVTWNDTYGSSQKSNAITFTFPAATNTWLQARSFYILDALAAGTGNILYGGDLVTPRVLQAGDTASFGPGSIIINED